MPEGDTVFRTAHTLQRALAGRTVTRFESVFPTLTGVDSRQALRGRIVDRVTARGKHLLIWFSGDLVLRTHMRMPSSRSTGSRDTSRPVMLDQQAIAGIGNIYKSETLFACRVHPFTPVREVPADSIEKLVTMAMRLLRAAVSESSGRGRWSVYGRGGKPCRRCGTPISMRKQGPNARSTYWCERCQPLTGESRERG